MIEGQRYLFLSYGQLHTSGVFKRIYEVGPGCVVVEVVDAEAIGETGDIHAAQMTRKYEQGQSGPLDGVVGIPWHDISKILPQHG